MKPKTLILRTAGTNCDVETAFAFEQVGADAQSLHLNRLLEQPALLDEFQILALPGGFSYGDDIAAGRIYASQLRHRLADTLRHFVETGRPIIGICNGFQVLVQTDLLPGPIEGHSGRSCTLAHNDSGRFVDHWIHLTVPTPASKCIWTAGLTQLDLPIAHGEGKFSPANPLVRDFLHKNGQIALVYAHPDGTPALPGTSDNPNGSIDAIAGICDSTGLVFGLMPHPERHIAPQQHPAWSIRPLTDHGEGLQIFKNAVEHVAGIHA